MNKLKRILTGIAVMTFMLSSVSCFQSKPITQNEEIHKEDTLKDTNQSAVIEKLTETSYKAVKLDADLPLTDITNIQNVGNTGKYLFSGVIGSGADWEWGTLLVESDLSAYKEFDNGINKTANIEFNENYVAANNGTIYAILTVTDYGDYELPDLNDPNVDYESFDYEEMAEAAVNTYKILTFDESGKVIAENEIEDFEECVNARADDMFGISECFALGDDKICISVIMSDETVFVTVDGEGNISEPIDFHTNEYLNYYGTDRDNNFVFMVNENGNSELRTLNADTMEISPDKTYEGDETEIAQRLQKRLSGAYEKDIRLGFTTVGPHRDDLTVYVGGVEAKAYASQGQTRTAALSMKLAEVEIFKEISGEPPVLILDDVMSELDLPRRKKLLRLVRDMQTLLTCTHAERVLYGAECNKIRIEKGHIRV